MKSYLSVLLCLISSVRSQGIGTAAYETSDGFGKCEVLPGTYVQWASTGLSIFNMTRCGQCVKVTNTDTGASTLANIVDLCLGCGPGDLLLNVPSFTAIGKLAKGRIPIRWDYAPCGTK